MEEETSRKVNTQPYAGPRWRLSIDEENGEWRLVFDTIVKEEHERVRDEWLRRGHRVKVDSTNAD